MDLTIRLAVNLGGGGGPMSVDGFDRHFAHDTPDVRLAYNPGPINAYKALGPSPTVRLAMAASPAEREGNPTLIDPDPTIAKPDLRLAHKRGSQGDNILLGENEVEPLPDQSRPALLVSYFYLEPFLKNRQRYRFRDWVMDSGAFSAHNSGKAIDLNAYMDCCKRLLAEDPQLVEVFALDVIGDWKASLRNTETMWAAGIPAIPAFHPGEPWDALRAMARDYPKIAIGGVVGWTKKRKMAFVGQCFARVWPKKIHGFGMSSEDMVMSFPFHSVDATNWELGPCKFGRWNTFGNMSVRGSKQNLRVEVEWYLAMERKARARWRKEMEQLAHQSDGRTVRLVGNGTSVSKRQDVFEDPTFRLALDPGSSAGRGIRSSGLMDSESEEIREIIDGTRTETTD